MLVQKFIIKAVAKLIKKQFKLDKILKYVEEPNELDDEVPFGKELDEMSVELKKKEKGETYDW